jgi:hypothetical protein
MKITIPHFIWIRRNWHGYVLILLIHLNLDTSIFATQKFISDVEFYLPKTIFLAAQEKFTFAVNNTTALKNKVNEKSDLLFKNTFLIFFNSIIYLKSPKESAQEIKNLQDLLSVGRKDFSKTIVCTYFDRIRNQGPWDVGIEVSDRVLGLPACTPKQHTFRLLALKKYKDKYLTKF